MATFLLWMFKCFDHDTRSICLTYPAYMKASGRRALEHACAIAGIQNPELISEVYATVANYAFNNI